MRIPIEQIKEDHARYEADRHAHFFGKTKTQMMISFPQTMAIYAAEFIELADRVALLEKELGRDCGDQEPTNGH